MHNSKPINIVIVAICLFVFGLLSIPIGVIALAFVPLASEASKELANAYLILIFGIADLVAAYGLWTRQQWARSFTLLVLALSILLTPLFVEDDTSKLEIDALIVGCVLNAAMMLLIWNKKVGDWLRT
ncbi:MAG: DUF2127 domain-containing protein [Parvibaculaceae bacterium]|nr:DUF2127 domain-containing protein [Parvibaculaceae bacterium]HBM89397.1 hypothetical protein [Rhodobiaceae bacterium]|tara:strand:- start:226 stop:609 length:384 start_codon:yes stop_codon:yes gene_type:complete